MLEKGEKQVGNLSRKLLKNNTQLSCQAGVSIELLMGLKSEWKIY